MDGDFVFEPARRINTPVIVVGSGPSGSGKTYTLLELAQGLAGEGGRIALIDTEGNRALIYADYFRFDHCEMRPPYSPRRFLEALQAAEKKGYRVIIVDSFSDEYIGEGGMVDIAAFEEKRVHNTGAAWAKPKAENKLVVRWFRQARCHVLLALRAEEKVKLEKVEKNGKEQTVVVPIGYQMICEKNLPYEATISFLLHPEAPGQPRPVKMPAQFRDLFPSDREITRATGTALAQWCAGGEIAMAPLYRSWAEKGAGSGPPNRAQNSPPVAKSPESGVKVPQSGVKPPRKRTNPHERFPETPTVASDTALAAELNLGPPQARAEEVETMARQCAEMGLAALKTFYRALSEAERDAQDPIWAELTARAKTVDAEIAALAERQGVAQPPLESPPESPPESPESPAPPESEIVGDGRSESETGELAETEAS